MVGWVLFRRDCRGGFYLEEMVGWVLFRREVGVGLFRRDGRVGFI